jgi:hypothetical protein
MTTYAERPAAQTAPYTLGWLGWIIACSPRIVRGELFGRQHDCHEVTCGEGTPDALRPRLTSGEMRVKDSERFVGELI